MVPGENEAKHLSSLTIPENNLNHSSFQTTTISKHF